MKRTALAAVLWLALLFSAQGQGISITNGTATISWPLTAYYYLLQSSTNLADPNAWNTLGSASPVAAAFVSTNTSVFTNFSGSTISFTRQVTDSAFYRLKGPTLIPVCDFAVFYDRLLEFSDSATLVLNGPIYANGPIYTGPGSGASQTFNGTVTTTSTITSPPNGGITNWGALAVFNGKPSVVTNLPAFVSYFGTNDAHGIIDLPPQNESPLSGFGPFRLYNQANIILKITNSVRGGGPRVLVTLQSAYGGNLPGADGAKVVYDMTNASELFLHTNGGGPGKIAIQFLSLTNTFTDQRQGANNQFVTQIDINQFGSWLLTNSVVTNKFTGGAYPIILYAADLRNLNTNTQAVVRLINGAKVPYNNGLGFTVATQNPLYVKGNYNITVNSNTYATALGSTTNGASVPAALVADAITFLSPSWVDSRSAANYSLRNASGMSVNTALLCGNVPSTGTASNTFSGGVHNLPRFLEDWSNDTLVLNTSLICLFSSEMATNQFQFPGAYYQPPTRLWGFDTTFTSPNRIPPGMPFYYLP